MKIVHTIQVQRFLKTGFNYIILSGDTLHQGTWKLSSIKIGEKLRQISIKTQLCSSFDKICYGNSIRNK